MKTITENRSEKLIFEFEPFHGIEYHIFLTMNRKGFKWTFIGTKAANDNNWANHRVCALCIVLKRFRFFKWYILCVCVRVIYVSCDCKKDSFISLMVCARLLFSLSVTPISEQWSFANKQHSMHIWELHITDIKCVINNKISTRCGSWYRCYDFWFLLFSL